MSLLDLAKTKVKWTNTEIELLSNNYSTINNLSELSSLLNKSIHSIQVKARRLKLSRNKPKRVFIPIIEIIELIKNGNTVHEVAKIYKTSHWTIKRICKDNNYDYIKDYGDRQNKTGWRKFEKGQSGFLRLYRGYRSTALKRGYDFNLSEDEFKTLSKGNCYYCNQPPEYTMYSGGQHSEHSKYTYNGIDRVDNNLGYTVDNCVSCCGLCNKMKLNQTTEEFLNRIHTIANRFPIKELK